jgi:glycosyltransferase involved in cell wall biosynthesis
MHRGSGGSVTAVFDICAVTRLCGDTAEIATVREAGSAGRVAADAPLGGLLEFPPSWPKRLGASKAFAQWLRVHARDYDLVEIHEVFTLTAWCAALLCRATKTPYIVRPHGSLDPFDLRKHSRAKRLIGPLLRWLVLSGAAGLCLTSDEERDRVVDFGARHVPRYSTPLPVPRSAFSGDRATFRSELEVGDGEFVILFLSRLDYKKGLPCLISAVARLRTDGLTPRLVICGTGLPAFMTEVEALVAQAGLLDSTHFLGFVDGQRKADAFAGADAFVLASDNENFGIAVVEAMYAEVPVVISDNVYISSLLREKQAALVVPSTPEAVSSALSNVWNERHDTKQMIIRAAALADECFSPQAVAGDEFTMRRSVLASTRASA